MTETEPSSAVPSVAHPLVRWLGLGGLTLIGATWRLWTPQILFPRVPLFSWSPPAFCDGFSLALILMGFSALLCCGWGRWRRGAAAMIAGGLVLQVLADQHRLQPWAWQFLILTVVLAVSDARTFVRGWRGLVVSIYVYSAFSKLDWAFAAEMGPALLRPWLTWGGTAPAPLWATQAPGWQSVLPWLLPVGELVVAGCLLVPRLRRWGLYGSWGMHAALLILLGPWGLNHSAGVLLWNVFFIGQNFFLFGRPLAWPPWTALPWSSIPWSTRVGWLIWGWVYVWPAGVPLGLCDPWLGWAVYAPPREQVTLWLDEASMNQLPEPARQACRFAGLRDERQWTWAEWQLDPNQWSLNTLGVPSYPASRFRMGVALAVAADPQITTLDVVVFSRASRRETTLAPSEPLRTRAELVQRAQGFWFNAFPSGWPRLLRNLWAAEP